MATELALDVIEQILVRLDVEDLIRLSVCKSWYCFISSPCFVKAHLKYSYNTDRNDPQLMHRRIAGHSVVNIDYLLRLNRMHIVGSSNGLVCISPIDAQLVVTNPLTREVKELQSIFRQVKFGMVREVVCWGFGYDSCADDYKVIIGFRERVDKMRTLFYALTLNSNVWKHIRVVKYRCCLNSVDGILYDGALHWFMSDAYKRVIISLDLATEEFKEIPQPTDEEYVSHEGHGCVEDHRCDRYVLGVSEECLCIYTWFFNFSNKRWIMKNNKWEQYTYDDFCETKYDVAHTVREVSQKTVYGCDDGERVPSAATYMRASIFVKSLVSPHPRVNNSNNDYEGQNRNAMGLEAKENVENDIIRKKVRKRKRKRGRGRVL